MTIVLLVAAVTSCRKDASPPAPPHLVERAGVAMGSELRLTAWTADEAAARSSFDAVFKEFDRLDALMSVWRAGSDVLRINAAAGEHAVPVSADVREALRTARQISEWTGGKFDVTFGALVRRLEVRPRSGQHHPGRRRDPARACRSSTIARSRSTNAPARCS